MKIKELIKKIPSLIDYVKKHWLVPPEGKSLSFKEILFYCLGAMGASGAIVLPTYITLSAGMYIAAALSINVADIVTIGIVSSIITIARSPLISYIVDNTETRMGKFRPWLVWLPIPLIILFILIGWLPYYISNYTMVLVVFTILFNIMQFFMQIYSLSFNTLIQVISPSPEERTNLMSVGAIVYSLGPSIVTMLLPLLANFMFTETGAYGEKILGVNRIGTAQWLVPIFAIIFFAIGLIMAFGVKERAVLPKKYVQKVKFKEGIKKSFQNKYFWIKNISGILGTFRIIGTSFTVWICSYMIQSEFAQTIAVGVLGSACVPGMALAPILIKKVGKKQLIITSNLAVALFTGIMIIFAKNPYVLLVMSFFITLVNSVQLVTDPAITAQIYDYQQYKTGDRLEGFLSQFSMILTTIVGIATAYVTPAIYKIYGYVDDVTVLYNPDVITPIIRAMLAIGCGCGILGAIPMFFWDLSENKHDEIMSVLQERANVPDSKSATLVENTENIAEPLQVVANKKAPRTFVVKKSYNGGTIVGVKGEINEKQYILVKRKK